jgi:hypothetical protein
MRGIQQGYVAHVVARTEERIRQDDPLPEGGVTQRSNLSPNDVSIPNTGVVVELPHFIQKSVPILCISGKQCAIKRSNDAQDEHVRSTSPFTLKRSSHCLYGDFTACIVNI